MAEFSKQYQEAFDFEAVSQICEGLGTLAVAKSEDGRMLLGVEAEENPEYIKWVTLETAIERAKEREGE